MSREAEETGLLIRRFKKPSLVRIQLGAPLKGNDV